MNGYERYMAVVQGRPCDFLPRLPILMQFAAEYIGSNYGEFASDHNVLVEANIRCCEDFGMDQVSAISDPYRETQGFGAPIIYQRDGVPKCPRPPLADTMDLELLSQPNPLGSERMRDRVDAIAAYKKRIGGKYSILGWVEGPAAEAGDLRAMGQFMTDMLMEPEFCEALLDRTLEVAVSFARAQIDAGADTIGIGEALASQVSLEMYETWIAPRERILIDAIHEQGALVRLHICGDITHLAPGIARLGIDLLDVDHMVDLAVMRQAMPPGVVLTGNLDPVSAVRFSTPDRIRKAVRQCFEQAGMPYMVNAGCEIPSGTPEANLRALCEPIVLG